MRTCKKCGCHFEADIGKICANCKKKHLEKQFTEGMTWALKNLRPMWAKENISKSNKLSKHFQPSLLL